VTQSAEQDAFLRFRERRVALPAPLDAWIRALLIFLVFWLSVWAWGIWSTPLPVPVDTALFRNRFAAFDQQVTALRKTGKEPIKLVFLGTSRIRNITLDTAVVTNSAHAAGVDRPVANVVLGVNWGGFERFKPALAMIAAEHPDVIVIMPELLTEDFSMLTRARLGSSWIEQSFWGQDFVPFADRETELVACIGFDQSPEDRDAESTMMIKPDLAGRGPQLAREFLRQMAAKGITVYVADVPVSEKLKAVRPDTLKENAILGATGLAGQARIKASYTRLRAHASIACGAVEYRVLPPHCRRSQCAAKAPKRTLPFRALGIPQSFHVIHHSIRQPGDRACARNARNC
jgi:hypothetical protein